jgi:chromosome segregation ATPase
MFRLPKLSQKRTNLSPEEITQRKDMYVKENKLEQLNDRVSFLKSDLPRLEARYRRITRLIKEAEADYEWMSKRIAGLEENNKKLREALKKEANNGVRNVSV